jgi:hypothetical protein
MLATDSFPLMATQGIDFNTKPIVSAEKKLCNNGAPITRAYSFKEQDAFCDFTITASRSFALTVPANLGYNVTQSFNKTTWESRMTITSGARAITVTPAAGATLYNAGASVGSVRLASNIPYVLWCPRNDDGAHAVCYLYKEQN